MIFSLRNIFIALLFFFVVVGGIVVFVSSEFFFVNVLQEVTAEKSTELQTVARLINLDNIELDELGVKDIAEIKDILQVIAAGRGVEFVHLFDINSKKIYVSTGHNFINSVITHTPNYAPNVVTVSESVRGDGEVVDLLFQGNSDAVLWVSIGKLYFTGPVQVLAFQQSFLIFTLVAIIGSALIIVARNFILKPLSSIQTSLKKIGAGDLKTRLPQGPPNEFGILFSTFNKMAERLEVAHERDKRISEMKSNFISTAAHQLRTPLTGIQWALGSLSQREFGEMNDQQVKVLRSLTQKNRELITIVDTLLNAANIEEGRFGYSTNFFTLNSVINELLTEFISGKAHYNENVTFKLELEADDGDTAVLADRERIRWVIRNLIDNAIEYTPNGGEIIVGTKLIDKMVQVSVKDPGIGISEDVKKSIFNKFYRAPNALRVKSSGNGLGLFICKAIINYHKGKIWFESEEGKGSAFFFTLPLSDR